MTKSIYIYILIMIGVTYIVRALPLTLIQKQIKNRFLKSFLYYVPYATLAVMTFPAILNATQYQLSGALALIVGVVAAFLGASLFKVATFSCAVVFISELIISFII
jgi:branched-subunit amino acid transport protein